MTEVNGIPVRDEWITLRADTEMFSQYRKRGESTHAKTFPAGTRARYTTFPYAGDYAAQAGDTITHWDHTATIAEGGFTYSITKRIPVAEAGK